MATKAKTLQVKDKEKDDKAADAPERIARRAVAVARPVDAAVRR
jgi:RNA polymerase primary sigma factor